MTYRTYRTQGIVLKSAIVGEADLLLTLCTPQMGKLRAVARGGRKPSSKLVGHLEPLTSVDLALARGRNLDVVTQAQAIESFASLKSNLEALSKGLYLAELVDGFAVEGAANAELYDLFLSALRFLCQRPEAELALRHFELHLLRASGFMPELHLCVECRKPLEPGKHLFSPHSGGVLCSQHASSVAGAIPLSVTALKVLRFLERSHLEEVTTIRAPGDLLNEVRYLLSSTLKYWLERELRSVAFLERLEREWRVALSRTT